MSYGNRKRMEARRYRWGMEGKCTRCGKNPPSGSKSTCDPCIQYIAGRKKLWTEKVRKEAEKIRREKLKAAAQKHAARQPAKTAKGRKGGKK